MNLENNIHQQVQSGGAGVANHVRQKLQSILRQRFEDFMVLQRVEAGPVGIRVLDGDLRTRGTVTVRARAREM